MKKEVLVQGILSIPVCSGCQPLPGLEGIPIPEPKNEEVEEEEFVQQPLVVQEVLPIKSIDE
jgi:hypothetical protein